MNQAKIFEIIQEVLGQEATINMTDSYQTIERWDSLAQLQILMRLDQETAGKAANIPELAIALSVQMIIETLESHGLIDA